MDWGGGYEGSDSNLRGGRGDSGGSGGQRTPFFSLGPVQVSNRHGWRIARVVHVVGSRLPPAVLLSVALHRGQHSRTLTSGPSLFTGSLTRGRLL